MTSRVVIGLGVFLLCSAATYAVADAAADAEIAKLQAGAIKALKEAVGATREEFLAGRGRMDTLLHLGKKLRKAELAVAATPAARIAAHEAYFKVVVEADERAANGHEAGLIPASEFFAIRAMRLQAEADLRKAGGKPPAGVKPPTEPKPPAEPKLPAEPKRKE
jgi:hypothetical protein